MVSKLKPEFRQISFAILSGSETRHIYIYIYGSVQNQAIFHIEFCHFLGVIVSWVIFLLIYKGKIGMQFSEFYLDLFRKNIFQGTLVPLYQENEKLGQSDKRGRNDPGDNDPEKVTKLNMKYGLVLYIAIYVV